MDRIKFALLSSLFILISTLGAHSFAAEWEYSPFNTKQVLHYTAYQNIRPIFNIVITSTPYTIDGDTFIKIETLLEGNNIYEKNVCVLNQNYQIVSIRQRSENDLDDNHYEWNIDNKDDLASVFYQNLKTKSTIKESFKLPKKSLSIQALMISLQTLELRPDKPYSFKLLVPPKQYYDMTAAITGNDKILYKEKLIDTYKVEVGLSGFFGFFIPKTLFWMKKAHPQIALQYQDPNYVYKLDSWEWIVDAIPSDF